MCLLLVVLGLCCCAWASLVEQGSSAAGLSGPDPAGSSSHGAGAVVAPSVWSLPRPGLEPLSPALAGGFLSAVPPGKADLGAFYVLLTALVFYSAPTSRFGGFWIHLEA